MKTTSTFKVRRLNNTNIYTITHKGKVFDSRLAFATKELATDFCNKLNNHFNKNQ